LYEKTIKFEYNIFHDTYVLTKTEGIVAINEARGNKQVGVVMLIFLTYNGLRDRRAPIKASNTFKKIYNIPHPPPKDLLHETLYTVIPAMELRMEFFVSILQSLAIIGETVYNVYGGSKFMYVAMVSSYSLFYKRSFIMFLGSVVLVVLAWSLIVDIYERTFVKVNGFS
jgi:hypothetical protein